MGCDVGDCDVGEVGDDEPPVVGEDSLDDPEGPEEPVDMAELLRIWLLVESPELDALVEMPQRPKSTGSGRSQCEVILTYLRTPTVYW